MKLFIFRILWLRIDLHEIVIGVGSHVLVNLLKRDLNLLRDWYDKLFQSLVNYKRVELATFSTLTL